MGLQRVSANDLTVLATDAGQVPMNIAAVLLFDSVVRPGELVNIVAARLARIPRMRQRLLRPGFAAGRPVWVDDPAFYLPGHVHNSPLPPATLVCRRLPEERPLWAVYWAQDAQALRVTIVVHHVVADGMGGLAALVALVDGAPPIAAQPLPRPTRRELLHDAHQRRVQALRQAPAVARGLVAGLREIGVGRPTQVPRSAILVPTSSSRHMATAEVPLRLVADSAHDLGATVNDLVLAAVTAALEDLLARCGEHPDDVVISVPVSARLRPGDLGNQVGAVPVSVPLGLERGPRVEHIRSATARAKSQQRGSSGQVLSVVFRTLAALHLGQYFVDHQRLVHTFETNLRGPDVEIMIAGCPVRTIVPIAINPGNVGVSFDVLSYAGALVVNVVACPRTVPDVNRVVQVVAAELAAFTVD
jgi:WS/DGAT/MGAT family acyltransferase